MGDVTGIDDGQNDPPLLGPRESAAVSLTPGLEDLRDAHPESRVDHQPPRLDTRPLPGLARRHPPAPAWHSRVLPWRAGCDPGVGHAARVSSSEPATTGYAWRHVRSLPRARLVHA